MVPSTWIWSCVPRGFRAPGETVIGQELHTIPGGKGANQAVAAAKLAGPGMSVHMIGRVGDDDLGQRLLNGLGQYGVRSRHMTVSEGVASGCAMILVDAKGENTIVTAPGANGKLTPRDIDAAEELIASAAVVLFATGDPGRDGGAYGVDVPAARSFYDPRSGPGAGQAAAESAIRRSIYSRPMSMKPRR